MVVCAWYENGQCTHSANLRGDCNSKGVNREHKQCNNVHTINPPKVKIELTLQCQTCGKTYKHEVWQSRSKMYADAVKRGVIVCCTCHYVRLRGISGDWTEALLAEWQLKWARQADFEDFMYAHSELLLNQDPEDFL